MERQGVVMTIDEQSDQPQEGRVEEQPGSGASIPSAGRKRSRRRGRVTVFDTWCKGCGLCVAFCPQKVFESGSDGHVIVAHEERCSACNWCYEHCPDFAIVVKPIEVEESAESQPVEVRP
jgi:2-oxoglutarate ferredoxin oxidoreductase subunit delta